MNRRHFLRNGLWVTGTLAFPSIVRAQWARSPAVQAAAVQTRATSVVDFTEGLVSYWPLNETSGNRADSVGSNTLESLNTVGYASGKIGNAADFTAASSQTLKCLDNASVSLGTDTPFTIALWVKKDAAEDFTGLLSKGFGTAAAYLLESYGGKWTFLIGNGSNYTFVQNGTGHSTGLEFVIAWHDPVANTISIQVNNGTVASAAWTVGTYDEAADFYIGSQNNSNFFDGLIDEVRFWKRVLSPEERTAVYSLT